jgi:Serine-pyruvate aminotransferase/archaeal aspartate aminotransferase
VQPLIPREQSSVVLRAYPLPAGVEYAGLHDGLKARGFVIYAGQGALAARIFRISTMGAVDEAAVERLLAAFAVLLA